MLSFERLENRDLMTVSFDPTNGLLVVVGTRGDDTGFVQTNADGSTTAQLDGQTLTASSVKNISVNLGNGNDYFQNKTALSAVLVGGKGNDYLEGGTGNDVIDGGSGDNILFDPSGTNVLRAGDGNNNVQGFANDTVILGDGDNVVYEILGTHTIVVGSGKNLIIDNPTTTLIGLDKNDREITFFKQRGSVLALDNGVLYYLPTDLTSTVGSSISIDKIRSQILVTIDGTVSIFQKKDVSFFAGFGASGNDSFVNNTAIGSVFYGFNGNDYIKGGSGFNLLKGSGGNDTIVGGKGFNDLSGNSGADVVISNSKRDILRIDALDQVFGDNTDIFLGFLNGPTDGLKKVKKINGFI